MESSTPVVSQGMAVPVYMYLYYIVLVQPETQVVAVHRSIWFSSDGGNYVHLLAHC